MDEDSKRKRERRRTCVDEMRRNLARHRAQRSDPATKTMLQLLALLSAALALVQPAESVVDVVPRRRTRWDPPPGYTLGRDAWSRERGLDPESNAIHTTSEKPAPSLRPALKSWRCLVRELDSLSPRRRESARATLEQRLPSVVHDWLRRQIASDDRTQLRILGLGAGHAELVQRALVAARVESIRQSERPSSSVQELDAEHEVEQVAGAQPSRRW
jgi:hypothetical protein